MGSVIPSTASLNGGAELISALAAKYEIAKNHSKIKGHQEHNGAWTSCPGDNLLSRIDDMLNGNAIENVPDDPIGVPDPAPEENPEPEPAPENGIVKGIIWDISVTAAPNAPNVVKLTNATVSVLGGPSIPVNPASAIWQFELPPGAWTFTASAPGYQDKTGVATVTAGNTTWSSLGLVPAAQPAAPVSEPVPVAGTPSICYPGPSNAWNACFELTPKSKVNESGYSYPSGGPNSKQYKTPTYFLNLNTVWEKTKLAKNFVLNEFMQSWKGTFAVYSPSAVAHWQKIRNAIGASLYVNSGYRSPKYNSGLDGAATYSRHMFGDAADVTAKGAVSLNTIKSKCNAEGADYVSVYTSHVHCDWRNDPLSKAFWAGSGAAKPGHHPGQSATLPTAWIDSPQSVQVGQAVYLHARYSGFDEGIPWIQWRVKGPGVDVQYGPAESFGFVARGSGTYSVHWEVGGHLSGVQVIDAR
jgi:hypothetical protein